MANEGYELSGRSKFYHALDSYVFAYSTLSGFKDLLKIEINYSDRVHVLKPIRCESTTKLEHIISFTRLADEELIGSKLSALLTRTTPRDIYDVYALFGNNKIANAALTRKIAIFYFCLGHEAPICFNKIADHAIEKIEGLTFRKIKESLLPVLRKGEPISLEKLSGYTSQQIRAFFSLDENDRRFIEAFNEKRFIPDVLFQGFETENVKNNPMGIWKTK